MSKGFPLYHLKLCVVCSRFSAPPAPPVPPAPGLPAAPPPALPPPALLHLQPLPLPLPRLSRLSRTSRFSSSSRFSQASRPPPAPACGQQPHLPLPQPRQHVAPCWPAPGPVAGPHAAALLPGKRHLHGDDHGPVLHPSARHRGRLPPAVPPRATRGLLPHSRCPTAEQRLPRAGSCSSDGGLGSAHSAHLAAARLRPLVASSAGGRRRGSRRGPVRRVALAPPTEPRQHREFTRSPSTPQQAVGGARTTSLASGKGNFRGTGSKDTKVPVAEGPSFTPSVPCVTSQRA